MSVCGTALCLNDHWESCFKGKAFSKCDLFCPVENVFVSVSAHSYPGSPFNHLYPHNVFQIFSWQFCSFLERASIPLRVFSHWLVIVRGRDTALQLLCDHSAACARSSPREEVNQGACDCQVTPVHPSVSVSCLKVAGRGSQAMAKPPCSLGSRCKGTASG